MKLSKVDLSNLVAIAHDEDFQLGLLVEQGESLEYVEIPAPVEAYEGLQLLNRAVGAARTGPTVIEGQPVDSTMAKSLGYDCDRKLLQVEFQSGSVYQFQDVDEDTWDDFQSAESPGKFFNREIKGNYCSQRILAQSDSSALA